jgi:hypothetical protein
MVVSWLRVGALAFRIVGGRAPELERPGRSTSAPQVDHVGQGAQVFVEGDERDLRDLGRRGYQQVHVAASSSHPSLSARSDESSPGAGGGGIDRNRDELGLDASESCETRRSLVRIPGGPRAEVQLNQRGDTDPRLLGEATSGCPR